MNATLLRWLKTLGFVILTLTALLLSACVVPDSGYYDDSGYVGPGYYEPSVVIYGGWGPDYHVAPFRGGDHDRRPPGGRHESPRVYRSAPPSHSIPSIPMRSRPGGGGGGSHGGRGEHR